MRTTLDIDAGVLQAVKEIAARRGTTTGRVISEIVRNALSPSAQGEVRNSIHMMPRPSEGAARHTPEDVNRLRDEALTAFPS